MPDRAVLERRFERYHSCPICPACLSEGQHHSDSWRHCFVVACVQHGLLLQDTCPRCAERLTLRWGGFRSCGCGHRLEGFALERAEPVELAISALIADVSHDARYCLPAPWIEATPRDIGRFIFFLGSHAGVSSTGKFGKSRLPRTVSESRSFLLPVTRLLEGWPRAFDEEVRRRLRDGDADPSSAPALLGDWYQRLVRFRGVGYRPFHDQLAAVIATEFDGPYKGHAYKSRFPGAWISAAEAAEELGVRAERVAAAIADGVLEGTLRRSGLGHRHYSLRRDLVMQIRRNRGRFLNATAAATLMGVTRTQFRLIADAGVVQELSSPDRPPLVEGGFAKSVIDELVADIRARTRLADGAKIAFKDLNLRRTTDRSALLGLIRDIFSGGMAPASWDGDRLGDFQFRTEDVEVRLRSTRATRAWTIQEAAQATGWKEQCIAAWCRQGLLKSKSYPHAGRVGRLIEPIHIAEFQSTYAPVSQLAKASGKTSRAVMKSLEAKGIAVVGYFADGGAHRGHLVRIVDLVADR